MADRRESESSNSEVESYEESESESELGRHIAFANMREPRRKHRHFAGKTFLNLTWSAKTPGQEFKLQDRS